ncbi:MATE family efflux transporter, partial [Bacillus cereus group sp. Bce013]|uniref:MATE family efflux transporter n=1 Tax=Bacillus cereus group sp. Bce013 TaxID=3445250 RepID=UPI003F21DC8A
MRTLVNSAYWLSLVWMALISGLVFLFGTFLAGLYTQDSQALAAASLVMFYAFCGTPATAGTLMNTALWQGVGNARLPFYATT